MPSSTSPSAKAPAPTVPTAASTRAHANKQCLSFPAPMLQEIEQEAARLERSVSWVVQRAWRIARAELRKIDPA